MENISDSTETKSTTQRVVEALAAALDTDPTDMNPPLYCVIDPDALNSLAESDTPVRVQFDYQGHTVLVEGDGTVSIDGLAHEQFAETEIAL